MFRWFAAPLSAAWLLYAGAAGAQARSEAPLRLEQAVERAVARNPEQQGFAWRLRAQDARVDAAALRPAPVLRTEVENLLGSGPYRDAGSVEATLALSQVIELGGKRAGRVAAGEAERSLVEIEREAAQLDVLAEVNRRFIHVAADQAQLALTQRAIALAEQTLTVTRQRLAAARAPAVEVRRAQIALARAQLAGEHAEPELLSSRHKLAAMWGDTAADFASVQAELLRLPQVDDYAALQARLAASPDALRYVSEARLRDAEIRLAQTHARADLGLSAGLRRLQQTQDQALVFEFSLPLFASARAAPAVREAQARRALGEAQAEAHRVKVQAQLFELYQELRHALTEAEMLRDEVLPQTEAALRDTEYAFRRGRYGYLEWMDAQRELIEVQRAQIEAASAAHLYQTEIERLTAEPLQAALPAAAP